MQIYARLLQDYQAQNGYNVTVGPPGRRLGTVPGQLPRAGGGRSGHAGLHLQPDPDQRIQLGHQPRPAGRRSARRCQRNPNTGGVKTYRAEPAAAEGCQRQCADPAAHQSGQQLPEPAAGGQLRPALRLTAPSLRARALPALPLQPGSPLAVHRHRPVADHPGQGHLGEGLAHASRPASTIEKHGAQRERVLGVQRRRNLLLRLRPRQPAGHQLSLRQRAGGQHLRLWRRQHEAGEPRALHADRVVPAGHLEGRAAG